MDQTLVKPPRQAVAGRRERRPWLPTLGPDPICELIFDRSFQLLYIS